MDNSENTKKIVIVVLIILILLGLIMTIKLVKKDDKKDNAISNTSNTTNTTSIVENTINDNNTVNETNTVEEENTATEDNSVAVEEQPTVSYSTSSKLNKTVVYTKLSASTSSNNNSNNNKQVNIDTTSPKLDVKYSVETKTNQDITVTIKSDERLQNIDGWDLSSDGLTLTKTYTSNTTEEIYVKDLAGNITTVNISVVNIDKVSPKLKLAYSNTEDTNKNVKVTITSDKELQELKGWSLSSNKLELVKEYDKNVDEEVKVKDIAGNEVNMNVSIKNIDKVKPENATVTDSVFLSKNITTKLTVIDKLSGINLDKTYYKIDTSKEMSEDYSTYTKLIATTIDINQTVEKDGIYYLHVISVDNAGNKNTNTIELTVDTVEPKVTVKYSVTSWTKDDVTVTVTANKSMKAVNGWTKSEDGKTFTKKYSNNANENVTFVDSLDRKVVAKISIANIDKENPLEPTLSQTIFNSKPIDNYKNIDISLKATIKDNEGGSGLKLSQCKYILNQSNTKIIDFSSANTFTSESQTLHFTIKENSTYYLHIQTVDNVGNTSYTIHTIISDTLNPIVTREYSNKEITNQNLTVTVKSNEVLKGKEGWEVYDGGLTLKKEYEKNTARTIETFYDLADNPVSVDITISNIDKVAPSDATINKTEFNTKDFTIQVKLVDDYSGIDIDKCKYVLDTNKTSNYNNATIFTATTQNISLNVSKDGTYYLHVLSVDKAGNEKDTVKEIKVDSTSPEYKVTYSKTDITNEDIFVTIEANEELKSVSGWTLSSDKKSLTKTYTSNVDTTITISDLFGNTSDVIVQIKNIDKVKPNATVNYSTTTQTSNPVTVTIKANESIVSTEGWTLSSDGLTLTKTFDKNDTETVTIRDLAGNYTTVSVIVANII